MDDNLTTMNVTAGVETLTITGADSGAHLRVCDSAGRAVATLVADEAGNAHLAIVPDKHRVLECPDDFIGALSTGWPLPPGDYSVIEESVTPAREHGPFRVLAVDDHPHPSLYVQDLAEGYAYLTVRDGVSLSIMVRFPNQQLYGPAPWPTVIEYSGYSPSDPDNPQPGTLIANLLGFAVVGVNMRGTGCSGGVFDIFSSAQAADGYDVVETVARQPWVLHGKVGMVGLSYAGISQLYVAATRPPHLAAITPCRLSTTSTGSNGPAGSTTPGSPEPGSPCGMQRPRRAAWHGIRPALTQVTKSPLPISAFAARTSTSSAVVGPSGFSVRCPRHAG
jgi:hypothetical protein